jgi:hypothetical protein
MGPLGKMKEDLAQFSVISESAKYAELTRANFDYMINLRDAV